MKRTKLYAKKTLSIFMAVMMLMTAWVFVPGEHEHVSAVSANLVAEANIIALQGITGSTTINTVSGSYFPNDPSSSNYSSYYKNLLYASTARVVSELGATTFNDSGALESFKVYYPTNMILMYDGSYPYFAVSITKDAKNNCVIRHCGTATNTSNLKFKNTYWYGAPKDRYNEVIFYNVYNGGNTGAGYNYVGTNNNTYNHDGDKGAWYWLANLLEYQYNFSGGEYVQTINPAFVTYLGQPSHSGSFKNVYPVNNSYATFKVINAKVWKDALTQAETIRNEISSNSAKYTTESVKKYVQLVNAIRAVNPSNYINNSKQDVSGWESAVKTAINNWNSWRGNNATSGGLEIQKYTITFKNYDKQTVAAYEYNYGSSVNCTTLGNNLGNTIKQYNDQYHQTFKWDDSKFVTTITDDVTITETPTGTVAHEFGAYTQGDTTHSRTCSVCKYVETKSHIENQGTVDKAETCTEDGIKTYDCSACGKTDIRTETINNISGHDFKDIAIKENGENGTHWRKCSRCDAYGWAGVENACEAHNWDKNDDKVVNSLDAVAKQASTCETAGFEKYECTVCSATWTKTLELAEHTITPTAAVNVSNICGASGNEAFWSCSVCDRVWKDANLTNELLNTTDADSDGIPDALELTGPAHEFTGAYVSVSGGKDGKHHRQCARFTQCHTYGPEAPHRWGEPTVTPSTCVAMGKKVYTCMDSCGQTYEETIEKADHNMTKIDAVEAECQVPGNNEYYHCSTCNKYYKDAAGTIETTVAAEKLDALPHTWTQHHDYDILKTAATCQAPAVYYSYCDNCKKEVVGLTHEYGGVDKVNGHKFDGAIQKNNDGTHSYKCTVAGCTEYGNPTTCKYEVTKDVASTCKTYGYVTYTCKDCKHGYSDTKPLDPNNHTGEGTYIIGYQAPTCATRGSTGIEKCSGCNAELSKKLNDIPLDSANHENMIDYDGKQATCQTEGYNAYRYCDKCHVYEIEKTPIAKKAHTYTNYVTNNNGTHTAVCDTCVEDAANNLTKATDTKPCQGGTANCVDKKVCTVCNTAYGVVDSENHKNVKTIAKVEPTCQTEGYKAYRHCDACDVNLDTPESIAKLDHKYSAWAKVDGKDEHSRYCTTCKDDEANNLTVDVQTAACHGGNANCLEKAKCADCKAEYGSTNPAVHKTTANTLKDVVAATCQTKGFSGNYRYNCCDAIKQAGEETEMLDHEFTIEVSRNAATCTDEGSVTYKCSTCKEEGELKAATKTEVLPIDAKNHATPEATVTVNQKDATCEEDGHTGDIYYECCYDETKTAEENRKALKQKGTVIKANGQHIYGTAVPEYMIDEITEIKDEDGKVTEREIVLKTEALDYDAKVDARHADGKWYHAQICTVCYDLKYTACYTYAHTYNCVDTDICEVCEGLCSLKDVNKHDTLNKIEGQDATHTEDGHKAYYQCDDCKKYFLDDAGKKDFDPTSDEGKALINISKDTVPCTEWEEEPFETQNPTCGEDGYKKYHCAIEGCEKVKTEIIPATADSHTWSEDYKEIKAPTCHSVGYEALYCTVCDAYKPNSTVTIAATGAHNYDKNEDGTVDRNDADVKQGINCQTPGTLTYTCQNEGCTNTKVEVDTENESAHQFGEWVTTGGDCSTGIVQERTCSVCGVTEKQTITTDTHQYELYVQVNPTPEKDGYKIEKCKNCGAEIRTELPYEGSGDNEGGEGGSGEGNEGEEGGETDKHLVDENIYTVHKKASCMHGEIRRYTCLTCGEMVEREVGEPTDHIWMRQAAEVATCSKDGHSEYDSCLICTVTRGKETYKSPGHNDGDGNGKCDSCNSAFYGEGENAKTCGCICHKENFFSRFIYKILNFFWKLFKIGRSCDCGVMHY